MRAISTAPISVRRFMQGNACAIHSRPSPAGSCRGLAADVGTVMCTSYITYVTSGTAGESRSTSQERSSTKATVCCGFLLTVLLRAGSRRRSPCGTCKVGDRCGHAAGCGMVSQTAISVFGSDPILARRGLSPLWPGDNRPPRQCQVLSALFLDFRFHWFWLPV